MPVASSSENPSQEVYAAGIELIGEFIDALDAKDRPLNDGEKAYLTLLSEAIKGGSGEEVDLMEGREGEKTMSAYNHTSGGALVGARLQRKRIKSPSINKGLFGFKGSHNPGDVWRSASGRWYTMNQDRRVVPSADPSQQEEQTKPDKQEEQEPTQLHEQGQPPPEDVKKGLMKQVGEFLGKNQAKANKIVRKIKASTFKKLPPKSRKVVKKMAAAAAWVEHKLQTFTHASQAVAKEIAVEKGLPPEKVEKVTNAIKWADLAFQWTVNIPVVHHVLGATGIATGGAGMVASKVGGFMPVASLAYIAYSTFSDPFATALAADKIIRQGFPKHEEGHEQGTNQKQPAQQQKAFPEQDNPSQETGEGIRSGDGMGQEGQSMGQGLRDDKSFDEASISELCDIMQDTQDDEWAMAVFCAAVDHSHDAKQAVETTRAALKVYPSGPQSDNDDPMDTESLFADRKKTPNQD